MSVREIKGVWYWETMVDGQKYYGTFNGKGGEEIPRDKPEAEDMVAAIRLQIRRGTYGRAKGVSNFAKFVDAVYLPYAEAEHSEDSHDRFRCATLKKEFGALNLSDITKMRIVSFINRRLETPTRRFVKDRDGKIKRDASGKPVRKLLSPTSVRKEIVLLSQIFIMAAGEKLVTGNPCKEIPKAVMKKIPARRKRQRFMSPEEERLIIPQLTGRRTHLLPVFLIALWTGMRRGEILSLRRSDLNFSKETVIREAYGEEYEVPAGWLFVTKSKIGKARSVPMCRRVREVFEDLCDDATRGEFLFESPVGGKAMLDVKTGFTSAVRDAGVVNLTFHDLRHTWSTRAEELGVPHAARRDVLGHTPVNMTDDYTHSSLEARERAVELVSRYGETNGVFVKSAERSTAWLASRIA